MGGAGLGRRWPCGERRRPEVRTAVWRVATTGEDRCPRRGGLGRSQSARLVSRHASGVPGAADARQRRGVRRQLVRMRSRLIAQLRAILRQEGLRVPRATTAAIDARLARVAVPPAVQAVLTPLLEALRA